MARRPLIWPFGGRYDGAAHADQPALFTRGARNVRNRDPVSGRVRGASASGAVKWNPSAIGSGRVRALVSTAIDGRKFEFNYTAGAETELWDAATPSKTLCRGGVTDAQGNAYALDGNAGIVKFNSAGREVMKVALPVADPSHVVRALWVDEANRIFAGVSEGGDVRTARVWCVLQLQDNEYSVLWQLEPGAYTEELRVFRGSQLYAAHNYPLENRSRVIVYEGIGLDPREVNRIETVAYPIHGMDLADGNLYTASKDVSRLGSATKRIGHPAEPRAHAPLVGWTPRDGEAAGNFVIHSWYDPTEVDEGDVEQTTDEARLETGQQVLRWRDKSGNDRDWFAGSLVIAGEEGPDYRKVGIGGLPSIYFDNSSATRKHSLVTAPNASIEKVLAAQQRTAIPAYTDSMWCMVMVLRPTQDDDAGSSGPRVVFAHENQAAGGSDHVLFVNRDCSATVPGAYSKGDVSYYATTDTADDGNCAGADQARAFPFDTFGSPSAGGAMIVTILWDGQVDPNDMTKTRCVFRVNGRPVDRFEGLPFASLEPSWLGLAPTTVFATGTDLARRYRGELGEIIVFGRKTPDANTEPKVIDHDMIDVGDPDAAQTDTALARVEAYLAYKWGISAVLRNNQGSEVGFGNYTHFYAWNDDGDHLVGAPPKPSTGGLWEAGAEVLNSFALVAKHDAQGVLQWVCNVATHPDGYSTHGGLGWAVRARKVESDGLVHVWSAGFQPEALNSDVAADSTVDVRKVIDLGTSFSGLQADGAWRHEFAGGAQLTYEYPRMASDKFGNLFFPGYNVGAGTIRALHVFEKDPDGSGDAVQLTEYLQAAPADLAHGVALPPDALTPDYRGDLTTEVAERVYLFTDAGDGVLESSDSVFAVQMVSTAALSTGNPEDVVTLAVAEDDIKLVTAASATIPTGGAAAVSATAQYVQALRAGEDIVVLDGEKIMVYSLRDGTVARLEATSAGEVPRGGRARYAAFWRHRLLLALEGGLYAASRLGNIRDWNLNPGSNLAGVPLQTATQAFTGTIVRAGEAEDSIVTLIPASDDLVFLVGSSKILRMTGDPQDGGQIHLVTDSMGGVFGPSWCKDDQGRIFMWGNRPAGLYLLPVIGEPRPLTADTLEASEFEDIDYSTHRIELVWDPIERTVRIFQVAWGSSEIVSHWAWEEKSHRAVRVAPVWQDRIESATKQPTAFAYLGGDDTRGLLVGCADGIIRRFDKEARDFDGTAVDSFVVIELTAGLPEGRSWLLTDIEVVLADDQEGCRLELFASETADDIGAIQASIDLKPGRNEPFGARLRGAHLWARLRSASIGRWSFEGGSYNLEPDGMVRQWKT